MGPKSITKARTRRTHSLGGCATCRRRHVKCDQVQPLCLTCKAVGVTCEGYSSSVQWMAPANSLDKLRSKKIEGNATRRHLYTEQSRASMSTELTANLSSKSVDASLTEIDSWSRNPQSSLEDNIAVGPFGVINFSTTAPSSTHVDSAPRTDESTVETQLAEDLLPTPSTLDPLMSLDDSLQWADLFALDFGNDFLMQQDPFGPVAQDVVSYATNNENAGVAHTLNPDNATHLEITAHDAPGTNQVTMLQAPVSPLFTTSAPSADLLGDAHLLLRHFQDHVIDAMAGVPFTAKSPWKILNLSRAVQTLADLTYLNVTTVKHANAANLYSLMSCAARHLAVSSLSQSPTSMNKWPGIADWALQRAKSHLEQSMRSEFHGPREAKYKDQLMATMGLIAASQFAGNQNDVRRYLLEAERVLRLRGLAKREISRKARMLHHVYTWTRIVAESTYVIHDYTSYAPAVQTLGLQQHQKRTSGADDIHDSSGRTDQQNKHGSKLDDFLRLETQHDSDLEIDEPKEATIGLHDIHLEDSRDYPASMYLQIYGIPETWLSLVSQTTRLANVMDTLKVSDKETNAAFQNALQKRASRLENMICAFAFKTASINANETAGTADNPEASPNQHMVQALNSALVIFFYRRVRDVNPWILQSHVDDVIKALQNFDKSLLGQNMTGPGSAWPAFIAGCEALASHRRETLLRWIQAGKAKSGLNSYASAEAMLAEVWQRKDEADSRSSTRTTRSTANNSATSRSAQSQWTWVDISREKKSWLVLC